MADPGDMMEGMLNAMSEGKAESLALIRKFQSEVVNRPAFGPEVPKAQRLFHHQLFLDTPGEMVMVYDQLHSTYGIGQNPKKPIPRRIVTYGILALKELNAERAKTEGEDE